LLYVIWLLASSNKVLPESTRSVDNAMGKVVIQVIDQRAMMDVTHRLDYVEF
jgi:hypothetical protein